MATEEQLNWCANMGLTQQDVQHLIAATRGYWTIIEPFKGVDGNQAVVSFDASGGFLLTGIVACEYNEQAQS